MVPDPFSGRLSKAITRGFRSIIAEARERLAEAPEEDREGRAFLQAVVIAGEGIITWAERYADLDERMARAQAEAATGKMITQNLVGGYMYLRSLIGPADLFYAFYDMPDLIHDCMRTWLAVADAVIARFEQLRGALVPDGSDPATRPAGKQ